MGSQQQKLGECGILCTLHAERLSKFHDLMKENLQNAQATQRSSAGTPAYEHEQTLSSLESKRQREAVSGLISAWKLGCYSFLSYA